MVFFCYKPDQNENEIIPNSLIDHKNLWFQNGFNRVAIKLLVVPFQFEFEVERFELMRISAEQIALQFNYNFKGAM